MSRKKRDYARSGRDLALLAVPASILLAWLIKAEADQPLDSTDIKIQASHLQSWSAEEKLLAEVAPRVSTHYYRAHTRMLREKIDSAAGALESSEPQVGLEAQYREARALSKDLTAASRTLSSSLEASASMARVKDELARIESAAGKLEQALADAQE
jgi:hypothetical protein